MSWFQTLDTNIQAAIIASIVTFIGIILKDFVIQLIFKRKEEKKLEKDIFKKYAEPLAKATETLFWRLHETINVPGRANYLRINGNRNDFEEYKYVSTLYRMAALLGWLRALKKEQSIIKHKDKNLHKKLIEAIMKLEKILADGPHVEMEIFNKLCVLWNVEIVNRQAFELGEVAVCLHTMLKQYVKENNVDYPTELKEPQKLELCNKLSRLITERLKHKEVEEKVLKETVNRAINLMSVKEAWLYRDWQVGIGDLMIEKSDNSYRVYEVISYKEFENMYYEKNKESKRWIDRIEDIFKDIDLSINDVQDKRIPLIRNLLEVLAEIIDALSNSGIDKLIFSNETKEHAKEIIQQKCS